MKKVKAKMAKLDLAALLKALPLDVLLPQLIDLIMRLTKKAPPVGIPMKPAGGDPSDDFPDDIIPSPGVGGRVIEEVVCRVARVQLNRKRFPEAYTPENPFGLMDNLNEINAGNASIPYASKVWVDLTARDQFGKEFLRPEIVASGLAYRTEHHVGGAFIKGHGMDNNGNPNPGYETNDTHEVTNGATAWISSKGFLHQVKVNGEGNFEVYGSVGGFESNHFTISVS